MATVRGGYEWIGKIRNERAQPIGGGWKRVSVQVNEVPTLGEIRQVVARASVMKLVRRNLI